jgi:hypothetical protein
VVVVSYDVLHENCVVCHAVADERSRTDPEHATLTILLVLAHDNHDDVIRGLCFVHRRRYSDVLPEFLAEMKKT